MNFVLACGVFLNSIVIFEQNDHELVEFYEIAVLKPFDLFSIAQITLGGH